MDIRLLGPLEVPDSGLKLEFGGVTQRSLLAANEVVSVDRLIDELRGLLLAADRRQDHPGLRLSVAQAVRRRPHPHSLPVLLGLPDRYKGEGLGRRRRRIAANPPAPTLFVRRGLRRGALAPPQTATRFSWSLTASPAWA
jgi:hypothetical protein